MQNTVFLVIISYRIKFQSSDGKCRESSLFKDVTFVYFSKYLFSGTVLTQFSGKLDIMISNSYIFLFNGQYVILV